MRLGGKKGVGHREAARWNVDAVRAEATGRLQRWGGGVAWRRKGWVHREDGDDGGVGGEEEESVGMGCASNSGGLHLSKRKAPQC